MPIHTFFHTYGSVSLCLKSVSQGYNRRPQADPKPIDISWVNWGSACFLLTGQTAVRNLAIRLATITLLGSSLIPAGATTLLQLGMQEMAQDATAIARVRIRSAAAQRRGDDVFTVYQFDTLETLKMAKTGPIATVAIPGGSAEGIRQVIVGAPVLQPGREYVVFLWTGRSGLTQLVGLSQGVFEVSEAPGAGITRAAQITRAAASEQMLDAAGNVVRPEAVSMPLAQLRTLVAQARRAK